MENKHKKRINYSTISFVFSIFAIILEIIKMIYDGKTYTYGIIKEYHVDYFSVFYHGTAVLFSITSLMLAIISIIKKKDNSAMVGASISFAILALFFSAIQIIGSFSAPIYS